MYTDLSERLDERKGSGFIYGQNKIVKAAQQALAFSGLQCNFKSEVRQ
jgi:hypothetical protein